MAEKFSELNDKHIDFIARQHMFFVGTAADTGFVNVSPKGMDSLRVIGPNKIVWLNFTGSGNESAAHLLENERMTLMFCSFDQLPRILRIYGSARTVHPRDNKWSNLSRLFSEHFSMRQIFELEIELVQTSCGYAVPKYDLKSQRDTLTRWADKTGEPGIKEYWAEKNTLSLNGKETGIFK